MYSKEDLEELGKKVIELFINKGLDSDVYVYVANHKYTLDGENGVKDNGEVNVSDYLRYARRPNILSIAWDSSEVYEVINYGDGLPELDNLLREYGLFYELGTSTDLSAYLIDPESEDWNILPSEKPVTDDTYREPLYNDHVSVNFDNGKISGRDKDDQYNLPAFYTTGNKSYLADFDTLADMFNDDITYRDVVSFLLDRKVEVNTYCSMG